MANPAQLLPLEPGQPYRIEVDEALSDDLIEDLAEGDFAVQECEGQSVVNSIEVRYVEVARAADGNDLSQFLDQWNAKEQEE